MTWLAIFGWRSPSPQPSPASGRGGIPSPARGRRWTRAARPDEGLRRLTVFVLGAVCALSAPASAAAAGDADRGETIYEACQDCHTLDKWLTDPQAVAPGAKMFFHLENAQDRADVIAYLKERAK